MTSTPPKKSLAGQILSALMDLTRDQASLRAESRVRHEWQTARIAALERRMSMAPPTPASPQLSAESLPRRLWLREAASTARMLWDIVRHVPWGGLILIVATLWQWLLPMIRHLLGLH